MADRTFYATRDMRYGTRRLRAGDPLVLNARDARVYQALDAVTAEKPRRLAKVKEEPAAQPVPRPIALPNGGEPVGVAAKPKRRGRPRKQPE